MKKRIIGMLLTLGLLGGLLTAMTGVAAANPCQIKDSDVDIFEVGTQTNCVFNSSQVEVNQSATSGDAVGIFGKATSGNASTVSLVETKQSIRDVTQLNVQ